MAKGSTQAHGDALNSTAQVPQTGIADRGVYVPPAPVMGRLDRQFLQLFWGARFPVLVGPREAGESWS